MPASCASRIACRWLSERGITDGPLWQCRSTAPRRISSITASGASEYCSTVLEKVRIGSLIAVSPDVTVERALAPADGAFLRGCLFFLRRHADDLAERRVI